MGEAPAGVPFERGVSPVSNLATTDELFFRRAGLDYFASHGIARKFYRCFK